jgi:hypothetical protein
MCCGPGNADTLTEILISNRRDFKISESLLLLILMDNQSSLCENYFNELLYNYACTN